MAIAASQRGFTLQGGEFSGERKTTQLAQANAINSVAGYARIYWVTWVKAIFSYQKSIETQFLRLFDQNKALEVLALGESHRHRVVWRAAHALGDEGIHACVQPGGGDDFVEQVGTDAA